MTERTYTNSSLACARRCLTEFDLRYLQRLTPDTDEDREVLQVGQTWHRAHDAAARAPEAPAAPYAAIAEHAPSDLWREKLQRLFAAYCWYWKSQPLRIVHSERVFRVTLGTVTFEGQMDAAISFDVVQDGDGRFGLVERKTTSDGLEAESLYWSRLRMDTQVGIYAVACRELYGKLPAYILYDVVRKPTINPKNLVKADVARMQAELKKSGTATYFGSSFSADALALPLEEGREDAALYGARLTADIGDRPDFYFARREIPRTHDDYSALLENILSQIRVIEFAEANGDLHRNPDACALFGTCDFYSLCSNNVRPRAGGPIPKGFRVREHMHPELARPEFPDVAGARALDLPC